MKKLILISLFVTGNFFAQSNPGNQSIELPDFVITGVQSVNIPFIEKNQPKMITVLSKEFFTPKFNPEDFSPTDISNPLKDEITLYNEKPRTSGILKLGAGLETLPVGSLNMGWNFDNGFINANLFGYNENEYVENAGENVSGGKISSEFFVNTQSSFLPGSRISADIGFDQNTFKFFASTSPQLERRIRNLSANIGFENKYYDLFNFGLNINPIKSELENESYDETLLNLNGFLTLKFRSFGIQLDAKYISQSSNLSSFSHEGSFISAKPFIYFSPTNSILLKVGVNYNKADTTDSFSPYAFMKISFTNELELIADYSPRMEYLSYAQIVGSNQYLGFGEYFHLNEIDADINIALKYEFETYFGFSGGINLKKADNYLVFQDTDYNGIFEMGGINDASIFTGFISAMFNPGPMGRFYGELKFSKAETGGGLKLPYHPNLSINATYGNNIAGFLGLSVGYELKTGMYGDLIGLDEIPAYHNFYTELDFNITKQFSIVAEFNNLLNRENYSFYNYQKKPFDVIGSIIYTW